MNKVLKELKKRYEATKIPKDLNLKVKNMITNAEIKNEYFQEDRKKFWDVTVRKIAIVGATCCFVFVVSLNINESFANTLKDVPVLNKIAEVFTFREYEKETDYTKENVRIPQVTELKNKELQEKVNGMITDKIAELLNETESNAKQIKKEIGNNTRGSIYGKMSVRIDYEVKYNKNNILSFILTKEEGLNTSSRDIYTYNYNIETGKEITLEELLGKDYKKLCNEQIEKEIEKQEKENKNKKYFNKEDMLGIGEDSYFHGISDNQSFYINEVEKPVIVFDKYSIAPGYMGVPEFEIIK